MQTIVHADIFFFITSIALVLLTIGLSIALFYSIKILRNLSEVSKVVKEEGTEIVNDVREIRGKIKERANSVTSNFDIIKRLVGTLVRRRKRKETKKTINNDSI